MRIAVVGAGISGLAAAWVLSRRHEVVVFEGNSYPGGHSNTVEVEDEGRLLPLDTGFIVFNERNYPYLWRLFDALGVQCRDSDMSFSVCCEHTGVEYNGTSLNKVFAQRRNLVNAGFWRMLWDILRFNREAPAALQSLDDRLTVADYVTQHRYGRRFTQHYLLPLGASLWSCEARRFAAFPIRFVIEFLHNHRMLQVDDRPIWKTVKGGARQYVEKLLAPFRQQVKLNRAVTALRRGPRGVELSAAGNIEHFDEVILATHADQSLRIVQDLDEHERQILEMFPYQRNEATLHTDTAVLPRANRAWASWNYRLPGRDNGLVTVTYNMNLLQGIDSARTYCVSLNQNEAVDERRVLKRLSYHHPLFVPGRCAAQAEHGTMIRRRGLSYCGAYWGYGFHEDGLRSALSVCRAYDMELLN